MKTTKYVRTRNRILKRVGWITFVILVMLFYAQMWFDPTLNIPAGAALAGTILQWAVTAQFCVWIWQSDKLNTARFELQMSKLNVEWLRRRQKRLSRQLVESWVRQVTDTELGDAGVGGDLDESVVESSRRRREGSKH